MDCKICELQFDTQYKLINHIKKHHPEFKTYESYVIHYVFDGIHPVCKCGCGTLMKFESHNPLFFKEYTKNHWPHKFHTTETKEKITANTKRAILDRYGVENVMELPQFIEKIAQTKLERYDDPTYNNVPKQRQTILDKYGVENYHNTQKMFDTNLKNFGVRMYIQTDEGKAKVKQTKLERYGDENYCNIEQVKKTKMERYGYATEFSEREYRNKHNLNETKIQRRVAEDLESSDFYYDGRNYDIKFGNFLIEIDGPAYHPKNLTGMSLIQMTSAINDHRKTLSCQSGKYTLIRVDASKLKRTNGRITFEDIWRESYDVDYTFTNHTKFLTKEYLKKYIERKGKDNLNKYWKICLRFVREFQPNFPKIESSETIKEAVYKINLYDTSKLLSDGIFNNNCSLHGTSYLKSIFLSYWKSSFKSTKSPVDTWNDDITMGRIIKYRIGLNNSGEVFDFTIHQLLRGLSALRHTVSFFKPVLAAAIYEHFLTNKLNPTVFDPCCGFGGRLLGFKSKFPDGTYIGCEPNPETFLELVELSKNFTNVVLYNCKLEDFDLTHLLDVDLTFTSIPYFDLETYSIPTRYESFDDWKNTFVAKLKQLPNLLVNIPIDLRDLFDDNIEEYKISTNTSHFNKKHQQKFEFLLKL